MQSDSEIEAVFGTLPIRHVVFFNEDFIVFVDNEYDVDWRTTLKYDAERPNDKKTQNEILNLAASIETTPCQYLEEHSKISFKRLIGEGIARALSEDYANAKKIIARAETFVRLRSQEKSRYWYLSASGFTGALAALGGSALWVFREQALHLLGPVAFDALLACIAGALGATLSIIMRMGKVHLDCLSGKPLHYMEGTSRVIAGSLSGLLMYFAVISGQLLPALLESSNPELAILFVAILSGASERWAPSIVSHLESGAIARTADSPQ